MISDFAKNFPILKGFKVHKIAVPRHEKLWIRNIDELVSKMQKMKQYCNNYNFSKRQII